MEMTGVEESESLRDEVVKTRQLSTSNHRRTAARIDEEAAEKRRQETRQEMRRGFAAVVINGFLRRSQRIPGKTRIRGSMGERKLQRI